jgi:hypothetical protein
MAQSLIKKLDKKSPKINSPEKEGREYTKEP